MFYILNISLPEYSEQMDTFAFAVENGTYTTFIKREYHIRSREITFSKSGKGLSRLALRPRQDRSRPKGRAAQATLARRPSKLPLKRPRRANGQRRRPGRRRVCCFRRLQTQAASETEKHKTCRWVAQPPTPHTDQVRIRYRKGTLSLQGATLLSISFFIVVQFSV